MIERIAHWFVEPDRRPASAGEAPSRAPRDVVLPTLVVLAGGPGAVAIASALALVLQRRTRARCALLMTWGATGRAGVGSPASASADRLRDRLGDRRLGDVGARGRLVTLELPDAPVVAAESARRVLAAAGDAATVVLVAAPRTSSLDQLLADCDLIVVATDDSELADLALASLSAGVPVASCTSGLGTAARLLALAGIALTPGARATLTPAVAALP